MVLALHWFMNKTIPNIFKRKPNQALLLVFCQMLCLGLAACTHKNVSKTSRILSVWPHVLSKDEAGAPLWSLSIRERNGHEFTEALQGGSYLANHSEHREEQAVYSQARPLTKVRQSLRVPRSQISATFSSALAYGAAAHMRVRSLSFQYVFEHIV